MRGWSTFSTVNKPDEVTVHRCVLCIARDCMLTVHVLLCPLCSNAGTPAAVPKLSTAQISEHYSTCIKLSTENVSAVQSPLYLECLGPGICNACLFILTYSAQCVCFAYVHFTVGVIDLDQGSAMVVVFLNDHYSFCRQGLGLVYYPA